MFNCLFVRRYSKSEIWELQDGQQASRSGVLAFCTIASLTRWNAAQASQIVQTAITTGSTCNLACTFGGTFQQFNPALGVLRSVTVSFQGTETYFGSFTPDADCTGDCIASFAFSTGYSFNAPGFPVTDPNDGASFFAVTNWLGSIAEGDPLGQSFGPLDIAYTASTVDISGYIGSGLVPVSGGESEDSDVCDAEIGSCILGNNFEMLTTLTYNYVPEPLTLALFGAGLAGLAGFRRHGTRSNTAA